MIVGRIAVLFFLALSSVTNTKADTIDYWHIYYNENKLKECNINTSEKIAFQAKNIKKNDVLVFRLFSDAPCGNCSAVLIVKSDNKTVYSKRYTGAQDKISFLLHDLANQQKGNAPMLFDIFYSETILHGAPKKFLLTKISIK